MADETKKTALGLTENFSAMVCYLFGWVSGLVVFLLEKDNKFVRFHAMQSVIVFGGLLVLNIVLGAIPVLGWAVAVLVWPLSIVLWIVLMVKAYRGEKFKIPVAGDMPQFNRIVQHS